MPPTEETARERQLERYLLGALPDQEMDRLEPRLLADHELFEELEATENDLVDRYLEGALAPEERRRFEERLLPCARVRERMAVARALHGLTKPDARQANSEPEGTVVSMAPFEANQRVTTRSTATWLAWAACLVLLLATGYLAVLNVVSQNRLERAQAEYLVAVERAAAAEEKADATAEATTRAAEQASNSSAEASRLSHLLAARDERISILERELADSTSSDPTADRHSDAKPTILFLALATRGEEEGSELKLPVEGDVQIQLDLGRLRPRHELRVSVKRSGVTVWRVQGSEPVIVGSDSMVPLNLPGEVLLEGTYTIEVSELTDEKERDIGAYELTVIK